MNRRRTAAASPILPFLAALLLVVAADPAPGQTRRPLRTEDVDTLDDGRLEIQIATEVIDDFVSPTSPLHGSLVRFPIVGVNYGLGDRGEIQLRAPLRQFFSPNGDSRSASGDLELATKLRLLGGHGIWPGLGARAIVKLPNVSEQSGVGTDETDVTLEFLAGVDIGRATLATSAGIAILGDPATPASQNDKLVWGVGGMLPLGLFDLAADVHGRALGDRGADDEWSALVGIARDLGAVRLDLAVGTYTVGEARSFMLTAGWSLTRQLRPRH